MKEDTGQILIVDKIVNNNIVIAKDFRGREVVAIGKGVGFAETAEREGFPELAQNKKPSGRRQKKRKLSQARQRRAVQINKFTVFAMSRRNHYAYEKGYIIKKEDE